jgi:histidine phosphotransfer protein HptB
MDEGNMIDWDRVAQLRDEIGDAVFDEVVDMFFEETSEVMARLVAGAEPDRLADDLHFLKGSALNFGFRQFGALCQAGEKLSAAGNAGAVNITALTDCYEASRRIFVFSSLPAAG